MNTPKVNVDPEDLARLARITQEMADARYVHGWLIGGGALDERPGRDRDRMEAERYMRSLGWEIRDVAQRMDDVQCGALVVPRPPREAGSQRNGGGPATSSGLSGNGSSLAGWTDSVRSWRFLPRRVVSSEPCDPEQRAWWSEEAGRRMRGQPARPRPWRPDHPDGYGQAQADALQEAQRAPVPGNVMQGPRGSGLFASLPTLGQAGAAGMPGSRAVPRGLEDRHGDRLTRRGEVAVR